MHHREQGRWAFHQLGLKRLTDFCCLSAVESNIHMRTATGTTKAAGYGVRYLSGALECVPQERHWLQQIRLGVYQVHFPSTQPIMVGFILTPLTEHGPSGYGYYCCNPPNANCPREKVWSVRIGEPNWDDDDDWLVEVTRPLNCLLASSGRQLLKWIIDDSGALVRDMHIMVPDRSVTQGKWFDPDEFNSRRLMRKIITICSQKKLLMSEAKRLISCSWDARQGLLLRCASVGSHY